MSETKATFAERTIRSLKKSYTDIWRNMDTNIFTIVSVCQDIEFEKNSHDKHGTKQTQEFRFFVNSVLSTYKRVHSNQIRHSR